MKRGYEKGKYSKWGRERTPGTHATGVLMSKRKRLESRDIEKRVAKIIADIKLLDRQLKSQNESAWLSDLPITIWAIRDLGYTHIRLGPPDPRL